MITATTFSTWTHCISDKCHRM